MVEHAAGPELIPIALCLTERVRKSQAHTPTPPPIPLPILQRPWRPLVLRVSHRALSIRRYIC